MARCCGSGEGCSCRLQDGPGITISGTGQIGDPFIISSEAAAMPNSLSIGTVTTSPPGTAADADITGTPPTQILDLVLPRGDTGPTGPAGLTGATGSTGATGATGPANSLAIGTVTGLAAGSSPTATITGTPPSQTLNLGIPKGDTGNPGFTGVYGAVGTVPGPYPDGTVTFEY